SFLCYYFFFQAEDGIRDFHVTGVQTCALPISAGSDAHRFAVPPGASVHAIRTTVRPSTVASRYASNAVARSASPTVRVTIFAKSRGRRSLASRSQTRRRNARGV